MKNIKKYEEFLNESFIEVINMFTLFLSIIGIAWLSGVGIYGIIRMIEGLIVNKNYRNKAKKIYDIFLKYKDDTVIKPILLEYAKLAHSGGEEEADGSKEEFYSDKRLSELSKILNNRLKELMSEREYADFYNHYNYIIIELKNKLYKENPSEYSKQVNYVPEWDKDTLVDKFLKDASDYFNEGYKGRNWRDRVRPIIENKWIIENDNIVLEDLEEYDDYNDVYLDEVTNEFIWDITRGSFNEGYRERNFRVFLSNMIKEKGYKISKK